MVLLAFNLIPIYPLDGGRILKAILHMLMGYKESIRLTHIISNICFILISVSIFVLIIITKIYSTIVIFVYLFALTISENRKYNIKLRICDELKVK